MKHRHSESHHDKIARLTKSHIVHVRRFALARLRRRFIDAAFHVLGSRVPIFFVETADEVMEAARLIRHDNAMRVSGCYRSAQFARHIFGRLSDRSNRNPVIWSSWANMVKACLGKLIEQHPTPCVCSVTVRCPCICHHEQRRVLAERASSATG